MNFYFLCVTQTYNAGDLLINRMLVEELSLYGNVYVDCYNCPDDFRSYLIGNSKNIIDVEKKYSFSLKKGAVFSFAKLIKNEKILLYTQSPGPLNRITNYPLRIAFYIIRNVLYFLRIPFVRIGNCCSAAIVSKINVVESNHIQYYVRSKNAVKYLKKFKEEGVHYIPDLAYLFRYRINQTEKKRIAIFSFREIIEDLDEFFNWLKESVDYLKEQGYKIIFFHQVKPDGMFMERLYCILDNMEIELRRELIWYDSFAFYADKSIIISNRLHCLLVGATYNAIPLAYIDNHKMVRKINDVFESSMGSMSSCYITNYCTIDKLKNINDHLEDHQGIIDSVVKDNANLCRNTIMNIVNEYDL